MEDEPTPRTQPSHFEYASSRTAEERESHFQVWLARYGEPYSNAVIEAGDKPWFESVDQRRELFMRRYTRPAPPVGLSIPRFGPVRQPLSPTPAIDDTEEITAA